MIELKNISKSFNGKKVLSNLNLKINDGESIGIVAPNGYGKTVLLEILVKKLLPDNGRINSTNSNSIFYQMQSDHYPENLLVKELIGFYIKVNKKSIQSQYIKRYLERYGLSKLLTKKVNQLSGGQKRKLGIVIALLINPSLIIMDEPSAGIDHKCLVLFREDLKMNVSTKLVTSHNTNDLLEITDRLCFLNNGRIEKILTKEKYSNFQAIYNSIYL